MLGSQDALTVSDVASFLEGEAGKFEVTLRNGVRFVVTVTPGESIEEFRPLWEDPSARPCTVRRLSGMKPAA